MHRTIRSLASPLIVLIALLICLGGAPTASAQTPSTQFGIKPLDATRGYFEYTIAAGDQISDVLVASNPNDAPLLLNIQIVRGMTMAAGGITFGEDTSGPVQWVTLPDAGTVMVPAQSALSLPFEIAIPAGTPPGEYVVGFTAMLQEQPESTAITITGTESNNQAGFQVKVLSKVAVSAIITVPDANRCEAAITTVASTSLKGRWQLELGLQNTGNVHFNSTGDVIARPSSGGEPVAQGAFEVGYFIPSDAITTVIVLEPFPPAGEYLVDVTLRTNCGFETAYTQPVSISQENVEQAVAEAQAENPPVAGNDEAARMLAQAELIRSVGLLLTGVAALVIAVVVVIIVMRRRKSA